MEPGPGLRFRRWWRRHQAHPEGQRSVFDGDVWLREGFQCYMAGVEAGLEIGAGLTGQVSEAPGAVAYHVVVKGLRGGVEYVPAKSLSLDWPWLLVFSDAVNGARRYAVDLLASIEIRTDAQVRRKGWR